MSNTHRIAVLILAAGASRRMGKIKQLLPWGESTLLNHTINTLNTISEDIFVVLGANTKEITSTLDKCTIISNPEWQKGMGTSISTGIGEIEVVKDYDAVLVVLADQPLLDVAYYQKMITAYSSGNSTIIATSYETKNGVPAILDKSLFEELKKLGEDYGARKLMQKYAANVTALDPDGKAIDIDTPEVYEQLINTI